MHMIQKVDKLIQIGNSLMKMENGIILPIITMVITHKVGKPCMKRIIGMLIKKSFIWKKVVILNMIMVIRLIMKINSGMVVDTKKT